MGIYLELNLKYKKNRVTFNLKFIAVSVKP